MLQKKVLRDPRGAALAAAAAAAALLAMPCPPEVPTLAAGRPRPVFTRRAAPEQRRPTAAAPFPAAAVPDGDGAVRPEPAAGDPTSEAPPSDALPPAVERELRPAAVFTDSAARRPVLSGGRDFSRAAGSELARSAPRSRVAAAAPAAFEPGERFAERRRGAPPAAGPVTVETARRSPSSPAAFEIRAFRPSERAAAFAPYQRNAAWAPASREAGGPAGGTPRDSRSEERRAPERSRPRRPRRPSRPRPAPVRRERRREQPSFRPLLLSKLIGRRPLHPPPAGLEPPPPPRRPERDSQGRSIPASAGDLSALEDVDPARLPRDRNPRPHWDGEVWHRGPERGLVADGAWIPLRLEAARWWAYAAGGAQLRHDGVWWTKERGVWLVVHEGRPWAWRSFQDWDADGLFHPGTGTEMVFSRDYARVAVITPGLGAEVYDAETGASLARIPEERMPARRRPRRPPELEAGAVRFDR